MNENYPHHNPGDEPEHEDQPEQHEHNEQGLQHHHPPDDEASHERQPDRHPRIWIGSLADYNNGVLHGDWVDAAVEGDELVEAARRIVASSETPDAEEWAVVDYDDFGEFTVQEYDQLEIVAQVARGIHEYGDAFAAWAQLHDGDLDMLEAFEDSYLGEYESPADWAREIADDSNIEQRIQETFGDSLASYIHFDADAFARDALLEGSISVCHKAGGGCWMFRTDP